MTDPSADSASEQLQREKREYALRTLPEHRRLAGRWEDLYKLLTNFDFLEDKCKFLSVYDLDVDYQIALQAWQGSPDHKDNLEEFEERLRLESHSISKGPELVFPHLYNHLTWLDAPHGLVHAICEKAKIKRANWLRMVQDPRPSPLPWLKSLEGHTREINCLAITPDGLQAITCSSDSTIRQWELGTGKLICTYTGHAEDVEKVVITADGKKVVSCSRDGTVKVWNLLTGQLIGSFEEHKGGVYTLQITPDETRVISSGQDNTIKIWDLATGLPMLSIEDKVNALDVTPDGTKIVAGSADGVIKIWDLTSGILIQTLGQNLGYIGSVNVTQDGKIIILASSGGLCIFELDTGCLIKSFNCNGNRAVISKDGMFAITIVNMSVYGGTAQLWDLKSGVFSRTFIEKSGNMVVAIITPDGKRIVSVSGHELVTRDLFSNEIIDKFNVGDDVIGANALEVTPGGDRFVSVYRYRLKIRDLRTGSILVTIADHSSEITVAKITPDGRHVVTGYSNGKIVLWNIITGELFCNFDGRNGEVRSLAMTPDGRCIISGHDDGTIMLWNYASRRSVLTIHSNGCVSAIAVTPDGHYIVACSEDGTIAVWQLKNGHPVFSTKGHNARVSAIAVTQNGKYIVTASVDSTIKVWDCVTWQNVNSFLGHSNSVRTLVVTVDGEYGISGGDDNVIILWKLTSGQPICYFEGHNDSLLSVVVLPGENQIISYSKDGTIKTWPLHATLTPRSVDGRSGSIKSVAITPDCATVISGSGNGSIKSWRAATGEFVAKIGGQDSEILGLQITQNGKWLISASSKLIKVMDLITGKVLHTLPRLDQSLLVNALAGVWNDTLVVFASSYQVDGWNLDTGQVDTLAGQYVKATAVTITTDQVIVASSDGIVKAWRDRGAVFIGADTLKMMEGDRYSRSAENHIINSLVAMPDKTQVMFAFDNRIKICNLNTGKTIGYFDGHTSLVKALSITRDGRFLFSASDDKTIRLWDLESGYSRNVFGLNALPNCLALSCDDRFLTCGDAAGHVWIFEWVK
jgi:WD40 repeat protein